MSTFDAEKWAHAIKRSGTRCYRASTRGVCSPACLRLQEAGRDAFMAGRASTEAPTPERRDDTYFQRLPRAAAMEQDMMSSPPSPISRETERGR